MLPLLVAARRGDDRDVDRHLARDDRARAPAVGADGDGAVELPAAGELADEPVHAALEPGDRAVADRLDDLGVDGVDRARGDRDVAHARALDDAHDVVQDVVAVAQVVVRRDRHPVAEPGALDAPRGASGRASSRRGSRAAADASRGRPSGRREYGSRYGTSRLPRQESGISRPTPFLAMEDPLVRQRVDEPLRVRGAERAVGALHDRRVHHLPAERDDPGAHLAARAGSPRSPRARRRSRPASGRRPRARSRSGAGSRATSRCSRAPSRARSRAAARPCRSRPRRSSRSPGSRRPSPPTPRGRARS